MHADELEIDDGLVRRLLSEQFPDWAELPLRRFASSGTVNALYRLGDRMAVRLPLLHVWGDVDVAAEDGWLGRLADRLPVRVPRVLGVGRPGAGYPCAWSISEWLDGTIPRPGKVEDTGQLARDLAQFVTTLHAIDHAAWTAPVLDTSLALADSGVRRWIAQLPGLADVEAVTRAWDAALRAPEWTGAPAVLHGDLLPGNLLLRNGQLGGVIDWSMWIGDPARDLIVAWYLLPPSDRDRFHEAVGADDATWTRARGMALQKGVAALPYYVETNPTMAADARHVITEILADLENE